MTRYAAIIFDMDGTLIDTIGHTERAYALAMEAFGVPYMSSADFRTLYEKNAKTIDYLKHFGIDPKYTEDFRARRDQQYVHVLKDRSEWIRDAEEVLKILYTVVPLGLATGAQRQYINAIHERLGMLRYLKAVVCADDEGYKRKPDPFLLLKAAQSLGVEPQNALYIGDQLTDVRAAKAARMPCCLVTQVSLEGADVQPDIVIGDLRELPELILHQS